MIRRRIAATLCVVLAWALFAVAAVEGTPFESLAGEIDARREALSQPANRQERRQLRATRSVTRELHRVSRGLKRDLRSAQKVSSQLDRAFPGDDVFDALLDGMLDGFATELSNRLFDGESRLQSVQDAVRRPLASEMLRRARDLEEQAATATDRAAHVKLLRRIAQRLIKAEKAIDYVPPVAPPEATGDPVGDVVGRLDAKVDGVALATNTVDASMYASSSDANEYHLEAQPGTSQLTEITLDWVYRMFGAYPRFAISDAPDTASAVIRRGGTVYDRDTSGEIVLQSSHATTVTGLVSFTGTFRVSASDAFGSKITVTGSFDVSSAPFTTWMDDGNR